MWVGSLAVAVIATAAAGAEPFRHLHGREIETTLVGKLMTDGGHWSQTYARGGRLIVDDLGDRSAGGTWRVKDHLLCINRPAILDACYEVWKSGSDVQLRLPGMATPYTLQMRPPAPK